MVRNVAKGEGFRTPAPWGTVVRVLGPAFESLPRRKPRGGRALFGGRALWRFVGRQQIARVAAQAGDGQSCRRERRRRACSVVSMWGFGVGAALKADLRVWRGQRSRGPARGWKRKRSGLRGGMRGDGHEVSILIRLGDGDRPGRAPSNVSMMIIRPPQHGHRRAGNGASASLSASPGLG